MNIYSEMKTSKWIFQITLTGAEVRFLKTYYSVINQTMVLQGQFNLAEDQKQLKALLMTNVHSVDDLKNYIQVLNKFKASLMISDYDGIQAIIKDLTWALRNVGVTV